MVVDFVVSEKRKKKLFLPQKGKGKTFFSGNVTITTTFRWSACVITFEETFLKEPKRKTILQMMKK